MKRLTERLTEEQEQWCIRFKEKVISTSEFRLTLSYDELLILEKVEQHSLRMCLVDDPKCYLPSVTQRKLLKDIRTKYLQFLEVEKIMND